MTSGSGRAVSESLGWALGAFHAAALLTLLVGLSWQAGSLGATLDDLGTELGIALYLWLVLVSWFSSRRALIGMKVDGPRSLRYGWRTFAGSVGWGGAAGALFFALIVLIIDTALLLGDSRDLDWPWDRIGAAIVLPLTYGLIGALFAAVVGAAVGLVAGVIDGVFVELAFRGLGLSGAVPGPTPTAVASGVHGETREGPRGY
jgi:hypothetical protein